MSERIPLTHVAARLRRIATTGQPIPSYRVLWEAAVSGRLPSADVSRGRWQVDAAALPEVAVMFGLTA